MIQWVNHLEIHVLCMVFFPWKLISYSSFFMEMLQTDLLVYQGNLAYNIIWYWIQFITLTLLLKKKIHKTNSNHELMWKSKAKITTSSMTMWSVHRPLPQRNWQNSFLKTLVRASGNSWEGHTANEETFIQKNQLKLGKDR